MARIATLGVVLALGAACSSGDGEPSDVGATSGPGASTTTATCESAGSSPPATFTLEDLDGSVIGSYAGHLTVSTANALALVAVCEKDFVGPNMQYSFDLTNAPGDSTSWVNGTTYDKTSLDPREPDTLHVTSVRGSYVITNTPALERQSKTLEEFNKYSDNWSGYYSSSRPDLERPTYTDNFELTIDDAFRTDPPHDRSTPVTLQSINLMDHEIHGRGFVKLTPIRVEAEVFDTERQPAILRVEF